MKAADIAERLGCHPDFVHEHSAPFKKLPKNMKLPRNMLPPPKMTRKGRVLKITSLLKERLRLFVSRNPF
jgi:hypothetical protein